MSAPNKIGVLPELERLGIKYEFGGEGSVKILCPFHNDKTPSCSVRLDDGRFKCFACGERGEMLKLLSKLTGVSITVLWPELAKRYGIANEPPVDQDVVEGWHDKIWAAGHLLAELRKRGVTDDMIRQHRLGENQGRVTIPIKSDGVVVNVRCYLPGAPSDQKMRNLKGRARPRLFPEEQLAYDAVALCGGEIKAIVAASQLNSGGIGAISATIGEGDWDARLTEQLRGKVVYVVYDVDEAGVKGAVLVAHKIRGVATSVHIALLPLDVSKHPKGDVNDFVVEGGDLLEVCRATPAWEPSARQQPDESAIADEMDLAAAYSHVVTGKRVGVKCVVSAVASNTFVVPQEIAVRCNKDQDFCGECPVFLAKLDAFRIGPENPAILEMVGWSKGFQRGAFMSAMGVPSRCAVVEFEPLSYMQADEIRLSPIMELTDTSIEREYQRAICTKRGIQLNESYTVRGRQFPHPRDQSAALLVSEYETVGDALSHYECRDLDSLKKFQPSAWTLDALSDKMTQIHADIERNVTRIRQRRTMHELMDAVWHSPLYVTFNGEATKGYLEVLFIGDSSQGKSHAADRLLKHYGVGVKMECKNATVAGLLGGLQQINGQWFVSWGVIPTNDKRLVILEELKGASTEVIAKLTDMRSSGVAEMTKIEKRKAHARTRLIVTSNARGDRVMSSHAYGVDAVRDLVGAPEDVRRFDACVILSKEEIDPRIINTPADAWPAVEHWCDSASCRKLVLWAWTRRHDQVRFEPQAEELILELSTKMCDKFTSDIPIVDGASQRLKLARVAAAIACRTFSSYGEDHSGVIVRECHAQYAHDLLDREYSKPQFGYAEFSRAIKEQQSIHDPSAVKRRIETVPHARDFAESILRASKFDQGDIMDWSGMDRASAGVLISLLVRKRAIVRHGRAGYVKTADFIEMLKALVPELPAELPQHLKREEY